MNQRGIHTKLYWLLLTILCGAAIYLRAIRLNDGIWNDEWSSMQRLYYGFDGILTDPSSFSYNVLLSLWGRFEDPIWYLRSLSLMLSIYSVVIVLAWGHSKSRAVVVSAALLFGFFPIFLEHSTDLRWYMLLMACAMNTLVAADMACAPGAPRSSLWVLAFSALLTALSHPIGIPMAGICLLVTLQIRQLNSSSTPRDRAQVLCFSLLGLGVCCIAVVATGKWLNRSSILKICPDWIGLFDLSELPRQIVSSLAARPFEAWGSLSLLTAWFAWLVFISAAGHFWRNWPYLFGAVSYLMILVVFSACVKPVLILRTLLPFWLALHFFAIVQISSTSPKARALATVWLGCLILFGLCLHRPGREWKNSWKNLAQRISEEYPSPHVIAELPYAGGLMRYYMPEHTTRSIALGSESLFEELAAEDSFFLVLPEIDARIERYVPEDMQWRILNKSHPYAAYFWKKPPEKLNARSSEFSSNEVRIKRDLLRDSFGDLSQLKVKTSSY